MGNCCGRTSGNFSGEGRTLDTGDAQPARPVQQSKASAPQGGRTLGKPSQTGDTISPKEAAARAAEARAAAQGSSKGALGQKLNQQRQQSQTATLAQNARDNLAVRDADTATQARKYN
ncbi:hypothetical protein AMS68_008032 [Peltaster fructicola]|uniref:Uncharacterized protein n=1 Tax=Peltaster fructicola TaxID=286661 RepID=A0A6H0Y6J0_9PEZI|nr:hypothetical protein AMS68_008032 [Peltaster fructicola]